MSKFEKGQKLITGKAVSISVHEMNGKVLEEVIEYPKGEVIEVLEVLGNGSYKIEFWTDDNTLFNGERITYEFDEETLASFLSEENEDI